MYGYTRQIIWLRQLMKDIGHPCEKGVILKIDYQCALRLTKNPGFHKRSKHVDIQYHFIRERYENDEIDVVYVATADQLADCFTKTLGKSNFNKIRDHICLMIN